jgi:hypothetical protein
VNNTDLTRTVNAPCQATPTAFCYTHQEGDHIEGAGLHPRVVVGWKGEFECSLTLIACENLHRAQQVADEIESGKVQFEMTSVGKVPTPPSIVKDISPCTTWD